MKNIEYFLLIQEKFYKKKVDVLINGTLARETFSPYQFEVVKTIVPKDTSFNKQVSVYTTFEVDMTLANKKEAGSMNGLSNTGVHTQYATSCFESALKSEFKINHKYSTLGLNIMTIMLASEVVYDSQTKERCKSISKVKLADFNDVTKGFIKVFRQNPEYWQEYVDRINAYAESMKSFSATDKAKKMISSASGTSMYKTKADLVEGFADATSRNRMECELFVVEGKSPASSLISGRRNTLNHAVLPLRGKVLNTSEKSIDDALNNKELFTLLKLIGLGINEHNVVSDCKTLEEAWEKVQKHARYSSIIIATDEDPDGKSIRNLLIYFICKFARFLLDLGMVRIVESPLYIQDGKYFYTSDPVQPGTRYPVGLNPNKPYRYIKGLAGLNPKTDIYDSFYNPATRRVFQVTSENIEEAMSLVEDIDLRKKLLYDSGVLSNPYNFNDL